MKNVLVTGSAGFIGSYVVREFVARGWHVWALIHDKISPEIQKISESGSVTIIHGDISDFKSMCSIFLKACENTDKALDVVVHCAGRATDVGWKKEFLQTNFESVRHLAQLVKENRVGRFVFVSTTDVYGMRDFSHETEEQLNITDTPKNPYPEYKIAAEQWIRENLPPEQFCIIRPAAVWGVGDQTFGPRILGFLRISPWIIHFGKWHGKNRWPLAHVRNVAMAVFLGSTMPESAGRSIHVVDTEITTADQFYRMLAGIFLPRKRFKSITLPMWIGLTFGNIVTAVSNLFNLSRPIADPSLYALYSANYNLDFSNQFIKELFAKAKCSLLTREEGFRELAASVRMNSNSNL